MTAINSLKSDDLFYKINTLRTILKQANIIINKLDDENKSLKDVLNSLASIYNEDYIIPCEIKDGSIISI